MFELFFQHMTSIKKIQVCALEHVESALQSWGKVKRLHLNLASTLVLSIGLHCYKHYTQRPAE